MAEIFGLIGAFQHFAIFSVDGLAICPEFAHIAALDLSENLFHAIMQAMLEHCTTEDVKDVTKGISHFYEVAFTCRFKVFFILFSDELIPQQNIIQAQIYCRVIIILDSKGIVKGPDMGDGFFQAEVCTVHSIECMPTKLRLKEGIPKSRYPRLSLCLWTTTEMMDSFFHEVQGDLSSGRPVGEDISTRRQFGSIYPEHALTELDLQDNGLSKHIGDQHLTS